MHSFQESLWLALGTINSHRVRSALTILGVVIGVTCVIAIGAILTGMDRFIVGQIESFGINNILVTKFGQGPQFGRRSRQERMRKPLSWDDYQAVVDGCPTCRLVVPIIEGRQIDKARYKSEELLGPDFSGSLPSFAEVLNLNIDKGRNFTEAENMHAAAVCVIGADVEKMLFLNEDPLGKQLEVTGHTLLVIGVFDKKKQGSSGGDSQDRTIVIPYETYHKMFPAALDHTFIAQAYPGQIDRAQDEIRTTLRRSRRAKYDDPDSFALSTVNSFIEQFHAITGATALVISVISSIGLLVGGVGVMNIMLVSVTERTREIGVRKAIGARRVDITLQFLLEAATLTGMGGIIGIIGGYVISGIVRLALPNLPMAVPLWGVLLGFIVSVSIGVFFGIWPAMKASRLDPVEALRYE